jgi:glutathione S-transferase
MYTCDPRPIEGRCISDSARSRRQARLGETPYLAGSQLTAADIMTVFSLTIMRLFRPYDLSPWPNILTYLRRVGARAPYQRAMQKADPDMTPVLGATADFR